MDEYVATRHELEKPPGMAGLALFMGFASRQSFYDYEKREGYRHAVGYARLVVEASYEEWLLLGRNATGPIFALKQMGWTDKPPEDVGDPSDIARQIRDFLREVDDDAA